MEDDDKQIGNPASEELKNPGQAIPEQQNPQQEDRASLPLRCARWVSMNVSV
jgi:hypothetical protein